MEQENLSRAVKVTDARAASIFLNSRMRRLLIQFVGQPRSVVEVAGRTAMDLKQIHYCVRRLFDLGLVRVAREVPRRGRAIKYYQSVGDSFLISQELLPVSSTQGLAGELRNRLGQGSGSGALLLKVGPGGEPQMRFLHGDEGDRLDFELWRILSLAPAQIRALRTELELVLQKYQQAGRAPGSKAFLVHCAAAARMGGSGPFDN